MKNKLLGWKNWLFLSDLIQLNGIREKVDRSLTSTANIKY